MSIATVKAVINGQTYTLTLSDDGYYTLSGTAPALSSANLPGGYYGVQIIATDEAGNETTINQEDGTWGEQLRLVAYESVKPTATITYPSADSRINTCKCHNRTAARKAAHITNLGHKLSGSRFANTVRGTHSIVLWQLLRKTCHLCMQSG